MTKWLQQFSSELAVRQSVCSVFGDWGFLLTAHCSNTEVQAGAVNHADTEAQAGAVNGAVTSAEVMTGGVAEVSLNTSEPQTHDDTCK